MDKHKQMVQLETQFITFRTKGNTDIVDLSGEVERLIRETGFIEGHVTVFGIGSTTGITTIEYEPGLVNHDVNRMFEQLAPYGVPYEHNKTWGDDNGASHLRSFLTGTSKTLPFQNGQLITGTWQQVIFIDFDTRPRNRRVALQFMGTKAE